MALVSVDLRDRAERSETFPKEWSSEKLTRSIERYEKFLGSKCPDDEEMETEYECLMKAQQRNTTLMEEFKCEL